MDAYDELKEENHDMSPRCLHSVIQVPGEHSSPICLETAILTLCF